MRSLTAVVVALPLLVLAGCAGDPSREVEVAAAFGTAPDAAAITYRPDLVPAGAEASVRVRSGGGSTSVRLAVRGLLANRTYGAHAHANPCGATGDAAGPHFQHRPDPNQPSTDPAFANPQNEVWLDLTTDADGAAHVESTVAWELTDRRPRSVVVHADPTSTAPGSAGGAGARAACVTVDF